MVTSAGTERAIRDFIQIRTGYHFQDWALERLNVIVNESSSRQHALLAISLDCAGFCDSCYFCDDSLKPVCGPPLGRNA